MLTTIASSGDRSQRENVLPLAALTLVTSANGRGTSILDRALRLLSGHAAALGMPPQMPADPSMFLRNVLRSYFMVCSDGTRGWAPCPT